MLSRTHRVEPLHRLRHLTERDRLTLDLLAEHQTLTTAQIATALFPTLRAAQKRLTVLYRIGRCRAARGDGVGHGCVGSAPRPMR
jgi:hypothetical protein